MNVREFKEYLKRYSGNVSMANVMVHFLIYEATDFELESISKYAVDTAYRRMKQYTTENDRFKQQLTQTKMYLKGEMYKDEETAKEMLYKQIENIERIIGK